MLPIACGVAANSGCLSTSVGTAVASLIWAALFATVGWLFGETALLILGHIRRYEDEIAMLIGHRRGARVRRDHPAPPDYGAHRETRDDGYRAGGGD